MGLMPSVSWPDARRVVGVIGDIAEQSGALPDRRSRFMQLTLEMIPAKAAVILGVECRVSTPMRVDVLACHGWLTQQEQEIFEDDARRHLYRSSPFLQGVWRQALLMGDEAQTWSRSQMVSDGEWYGSAYVQTVYRPLRIDDILISLTPTNRSGYWRGFALVRPWGDRMPFGARDRMVATLLNTGCGVLYRDAPALAEHNGDDLPRRLQQVRALLVRGMTEREIADSLRLSPCTVHRHVGRLYRQLGVHSQVELMARQCQTT